MEAAVAEKEAGMTEWNDGRLDDLGDRVDRIEKKVDSGFAQADQKMEAEFARIDGRFKEMDQKMEAGFARIDGRFKEMDQKMEAGFARMDAKFDAFFLHMDAKFDAVNERFEDMHRMLFRSAWALVIGLLGLLSVLIGVIAAQS